MNDMPGSNPLISILIPSNNHQQYIEQTIRSIWAQPYRQVEIIVIDDCSSDGSVAVLKRLQAESPCWMEVLINEENRGPAITLNRAIGRAKGGLLALFSSDDLYAEDPFSCRVEMFKKDPGLQIVYGNGLRFDEHGIRGVVHQEEVAKLLARSASEILEYLYTNTSPLFMQAALLKKELMLKVGCFDESLKADDWAINTKIFQELVCSGGGYAYLDESVFLYRNHDNNVHKNLSRHIALKLEFIEKITPEYLKDTARSNILFGVSLQAAKDQQFSVAIDLFRQSQRKSINIKKVMKFMQKFLYCRTVGTLLLKFNKARRFLTCNIEQSSKGLPGG